jgi:hypothetical protein
VWKERNADAIDRYLAADGLAHGIEGPPVAGALTRHAMA